MDYKHERKVSLLEGEKLFFNKVLSRDHSSVGCSSRILYYRSNAEGVPFKWEMQPGMPKELPKEDIIPPLSPPPAVLSLGLPKPSIDIEEPPNKASILKSKLMFWKQSNKKSQGVKKFQNMGSKENDFVNIMEVYSSDGEGFMASPPRNSSSTSFSSNSSLSCSNNAHDSWQSASSRVQSPVREKIYGGCSPWHITSVLVRVGRRI